MAGELRRRLGRDDGLYARLVAACSQDWRRYTEHAFVAALGDGSLAEAAFRRYLIQDYLFLIHFARAYALAVYKADDLADMRAAAATLNALLDVEMKLHVDYCAGWGLTEAEMATAPEEPATLAYTRYVLETGMAGDALDLAVALAPCVIGYAEIGAALAADPATAMDDNPYKDWIEMYASDDYLDMAQAAADQLDRLAEARLTPARGEPLARIFRTATCLEAKFWTGQ